MNDERPRRSRWPWVGVAAFAVVGALIAGRDPGNRVGLGSLTFTVTDDGRGFDPATTGYGTGLQGISDRLAAVGGLLVVRSEPGRGTSLRGSVPVEDRP